MIYVIADDITGAAEIAGVAHRYGLQTSLSTSVPSANEGIDVVVIATDARSYSAPEAARMTADVAKEISSMTASGEKVVIFRKTDSALRGNVREELQAIIDNTHYTDVVYMPANPSKGRIISDGTYYVNGTPIAETDFRFDPEFPAWSSSVAERFPGLRFANATTKEDVAEVVLNALADGCMLAGAADLFAALIERVFDVKPCSADASRKSLTSIVADARDGGVLIVCGSTLSKVMDLNISVESMPLDVFYEEADAHDWTERILGRYERNRSCILAIGDKEIRKGKEAAIYLRETMAEVTCSLLKAHEPAELIIEGGATAFAILARTAYSVFSITDEIAPGVVRMTTDSGMHITMKPGSYSWK